MGKKNIVEFDVAGEDIKSITVRVVKPDWTSRVRLETHIYLHNGQNLVVEDSKPVVAQLDAVNAIYRTRMLKKA